MMRLYKFRPLSGSISDCSDGNSDYARLTAILETGNFRCSHFYELNDPMEGTFSAYEPKLINPIFDEKSQYRICSFSGINGFSNPLMWGYYANGFKGVAIEIEVDGSEIFQIEYVEEISTVEKPPSEEEIRKILTSKFKNWQHEDEFRYLKKFETYSIKVGNIKAIYFGNPYGASNNKDTIHQNGNLRDYFELSEKLKIVARQKDIECYDVTIRSGKIFCG